MVYFFRCKCGTSYSARDAGATSSGRPCPKCETMNRWVRIGDGMGLRGMGEHLSEALGVDPSQIAEAQRRFPDHKFTPDGRMILSGSRERVKVLRELGFVDNGNKHRNPADHPKFGQ